MNQDYGLMDCRDSGDGQKQSSQEIRGTAKEPNNRFRGIRIIQIFIDRNRNINQQLRPKE